MTKYNIHIFREMRLYFPDIEAESPEDAARIASETDTDVAEDINDCNGVDLGATVDFAGDEFFTNSQTIDFEPQRLLNASPKLLAYAECEAAIACGKADPRYNPNPILQSHGWNRETESLGLFLTRIRRVAIEAATGSYLGRSI